MTPDQEARNKRIGALFGWSLLATLAAAVGLMVFSGSRSAVSAARHPDVVVIEAAQLSRGELPDAFVIELVGATVDASAQVSRKHPVPGSRPLRRATVYEAPVLYEGVPIATVRRRDHAIDVHAPIRGTWSADPPVITLTEVEPAVFSVLYGLVTVPFLLVLVGVPLLVFRMRPTSWRLTSPPRPSAAPPRRNPARTGRPPAPPPPGRSMR